MRLPLAVYKLTKMYFGHHGCWHRLREPTFTQAQRDECFPPDEVFPKGLRNWNEKGNGEDFLKFHRLMIRNFKWILEQLPEPRYAYIPWKDFPDWLAPIIDAADPTYRERLEKELEKKIRTAELDDLGQFIEGAAGANDDFPQVHWLVHDLVAKYEALIFGRQPAANMSDMSTACFNEHFWRFHGLIDHWYAQWQREHGEKVDQSALMPHEHAMCERCQTLKSPVSLLPRLEGYIRLRSE